MVRDDRAGIRGLGIVLITFFFLIGPLPLIGVLIHGLQSSTPLITMVSYLSPSLLVLILFYAPLSLFLGSAYLRQAPYWKLVNNRRQTAAAWGFAARVPLAQPHPLPNVGALPLPFTITLRPAWPLFLAPLGGITGLFVLMQIRFNFPGGFVFACISGALIGISFWLFFPRKIEVTQDGLIVRHPFYDWWATEMRSALGTRTMRWSEARLFAVRDGKPGEPAIHYELSSPFEVVKWHRIRRPRWWSLYRPAIPFAEYDAQMEALIALISGVTGLPLYDVR